MSVIDTLIYDRTSADVEQVYALARLWAPGSDGKPVFTGTPEQKALWNAGLKGAYNAADLNRVGAALLFLAQKLTENAYPVTVTPKTDWKGPPDPDVPTMTDLQHYLNQIAIIRAALPVFPTTPAVPDDLPDFTWQDANAIEKILVDVETLINNMAAAWFYCGDLYCGEA